VMAFNQNDCVTMENISIRKRNTKKTAEVITCNVISNWEKAIAQHQGAAFKIKAT